MKPYDFEDDSNAPAVAAAADAPTPSPWRDTRVVGTRMPRVDAYDRVSGTATYASDVSLPGMLHAAVARCPHGHARVTRVDVGRAARMPGVRAVITAQTPGTDIGWYAGPRGPLSRIFDAHCRFAGEEIAAVAADTPHQAHDAVGAIEIEYQTLPFAVDVEAALAPGATPILGESNRAGDPRVVERGDLAAGLAAADVVVEGEYSTAAELHVPLEPHGCVARWDGTRLTVWDSLQGVFSAQATLARALRLPLARVRVIGPYMGGGFGSKLDTGKHGVIAALLAQQTGRPVRLFLTREETMLAIGNRPAVRMRVRVGATRDGTLTAIDFDCVGSGGAYSANGTGGVDWQALDLYRCPNVRARSTNVFVNLGPERPFRAPGHPQGAWGLEQALDELATRLTIDPVALRLRNLSEVSQARPGQPRYTSTGFRECLVEGAKAFGWAGARAAAAGPGPIRRGVGMAGGMWRGGGGNPPATVLVRLFADGSANVNMGASDLGTGTKTWAAMIVAEELGIAVDRVSIEHADTATTQFTHPSGGSKTVPTEAPAIRAAVIDVKRQVLELAATQLKADPAALELREAAIVPPTGDPLPIDRVQALAQRGVIVGVGVRGPDTHGLAVNPFGVHFAEVAVNTRTGEVRVTRMVAAQDSGRVMNRLTYDNQVFGGIVQGTGMALTEERVADAAHEGRVLNANLHDYKVPTALDAVAAPVCVPIDPGDTLCNSTGAKGLGEPALIPAAAAVANAVAHAIGVRVAHAPITPARVLTALGAAARKSEARA